MARPLPIRVVGDRTNDDWPVTLELTAGGGVRIVQEHDPRMGQRDVVLLTADQVRALLTLVKTAKGRVR